MILVKVYDKYINRLSDEFKIDTDIEKFSVGNYITCSKTVNGSTVSTSYKIKSIYHEIVFENGYEKDTAKYVREVMNVTLI